MTENSETNKNTNIDKTIPAFYVGTLTRNYIGRSHLKLVCQNRSSPWKKEAVKLFEVLKILTHSQRISAMESIAIKVENQDPFIPSKIICFFRVGVSNSAH